jgi:Kef-type K+ transport system membrane component KefB
MELHIPPLLLIATIAVMAPLVVELPLGVRLPIVVIEVLLGIVVGPHGLHLIAAEGIVAFLGQLGLALLFFLAGLELDLALIRGRPLTLAIEGWCLSLGLALVLSGLLYSVGFVHAPLLVAPA